MPLPTIYTIGHSNHEIERFIELLKGAGIHTVVDVRSQPYSRWAGQFNREGLARMLERAGFAYRWMGDALGGRPADSSLYADESDESSGKHARPDYALMAASAAFQAGLDKLLALAEPGATARPTPPDHGRRQTKARRLRRHHPGHRRRAR